MIWLIPFFLFLLVVAAWAFFAQDYYIDICTTQVAPTAVQVTSKLGDFIISQEYSAAELTDLFSADRAQVTGGKVLGLAKTDIKYEFSTSIEGRSLLGRSCATPQIRAGVSFSNPEIYMATDLDSQGCMYYEVLKHEAEHVTIYREYAQLIEHTLRNHLEAKYPAGFIFKDRTNDSLEAEMQRLVNTELPELIQPLIAEAEKAQAQVDTLEEYRRLAKVCAR